MQESLLGTLIRSFIGTFAKVTAFVLALFLSILFIALVQKNEDEIPNNFDAEILPNAEGVRKKQSASSPVILQIDIQGVIGGEGLEQKDIENLLVESRENSLKKDRVKGVLLRINTPGGGAADSDGIYRALLEYKARYKVPIIAFVDGLCASGGMFVACAADEVVATPMSMIGSVGVITSPFMNVSKTMEKVGVDSLTLYAGKGKDDLSPFRPWKEGEAKNLKEIIDASYLHFVDIVATHRKNLSKEKLINSYGAGIFIADKAKEYGYIDALVEGRSEALKRMLAKLSIEDEFYQVIRLDSTNWIAQITKSKSPLFTGKVKHQILGTEEVPERLQNQPLYLYRP